MSIPPGTGCVRIGNYVGPELTVSFTNQTTGAAHTDSVPSNQTRFLCMAPARYAVTADAPPPWNTLNFEIEVKAGEGLDLPLMAR